MERYKRSETTRLALLDAAVELFAEKGMAGASVRDIVKMAGTSLASVNYYFGGKENLYIEAIHYVMVEKLAIPKFITDLIDSNPKTPLEMSNALCAMIEGLFQSLFCTNFPHREDRFVMRIMLDMTQKEHEVFTELMPFEEFEKLLLRRCPGTDFIDVNIVIITIFAQIEQLILARSLVLERLRKSDYDDATIRRIVIFTEKAVLEALHLPLPDSIRRINSKATDQVS